MVTEDEVSLLDEQYPWGNLRQKRQHSSLSLRIVIALICSSVGFLLGTAIGPYWPGRLDGLCLAKATIPCECSPIKAVSTFG
jgi:hypothetical protein